MKRKLCTILLVALMLIGSMPVFATETTMVPETFEEIQAAFPQAQIIEGNPDVKIIQVINGETVYGYQSFNPDAEPVATYTKEFSDGSMTLQVFADGSYNATSIIKVVGVNARSSDERFEAIYYGMLGSYARFRIDYSTSGLVTRGPYDRYFHPYGGQSWQNEGYGTMLARTAAYMDIGMYAPVYDAYGVLEDLEYIMTVRLEAYVNGGDPYSRSYAL